MDETVGSRIRQARKVKNMTQKQLGELIGFSCMGLSYLENGSRKVKLDDLIKISKVLEVSVEWLLYPVLKIKTITRVY